jgi:mannose-6-phosphate isomerase-like protein (cupin superfamily)
MEKKMRSHSMKIVVTFTYVALLMLVSVRLAGQTKPAKPKACVIQLSDTTSSYQRVLGGPPQTATMHSGLVVLLPSKSVGKHSTKKYEEAIFILEGTGEMRIAGGETLKLEPRTVAYCPPHTEHDIENTGTQPLRYLYVAAKIEP